MQFLAFWAKKLSWKEVASSFNISWEKVFHAVEYVVEWGLTHRSLDSIKAIGVDEVAYQIRTCTQLLSIGQERTTATIQISRGFSASLARRGASNWRLPVLT